MFLFTCTSTYTIRTGYEFALLVGGVLEARECNARHIGLVAPDRLAEVAFSELQRSECATRERRGEREPRAPRDASRSCRACCRRSDGRPAERAPARPRGLRRYTCRTHLVRTRRWSGVSLAEVKMQRGKVWCDERKCAAFSTWSELEFALRRVIHSLKINVLGAAPANHVTSGNPPHFKCRNSCTVNAIRSSLNVRNGWVNSKIFIEQEANKPLRMHCHAINLEFWLFLRTMEITPMHILCLYSLQSAEVWVSRLYS